MKMVTGREETVKTALDVIKEEVDMYRCDSCKEEFRHPEIKMPDTGLVRGEGILGMAKLDPVKFCPECLSTQIEEVKDDSEV